jgi:uncharacterized protein Yka (UPF0111/DUF47 family)
MSKELGFFELFEKHAHITLEAARGLLAAVENLDRKEELVGRIQEMEHQADNTLALTMELVHRTFITPLDRDEITRVITKLDDIIDFVDAAAHRLTLFGLNQVPPDVRDICQVLIGAQELVCEMIPLLRHLKHAKKITELARRINDMENKGDKLHRQGIASLFQRYQNDPLMVIKVKEVYEIIEEAIDACEDIANIVECIVLEHS